MKIVVYERKRFTNASLGRRRSRMALSIRAYLSAQAFTL
jgi:hypothetical protein